MRTQPQKTGALLLLFCSLLQSCTGAVLTMNDKTKPRDLAQELLNAAKEGNKATVERLLEQGVSVDVKDAEGITPLALACERNHAAVAALLINTKANVEQRGRWGNPILLHACAAGLTKTATCLIQAKADVNAKGKGDTTVLQCTVANYRIKSLELLRNANVSIAPKQLKLIWNECRSGIRAVFADKLWEKHSTTPPNWSTSEGTKRAQELFAINDGRWIRQALISLDTVHQENAPILLARLFGLEEQATAKKQLSRLNTDRRSQIITQVWNGLVQAQETVETIKTPTAFPEELVNLITAYVAYPAPSMANAYAQLRPRQKVNFLEFIQTQMER